MVLGVEGARQGGKARRSGDACDSLFLWGMGAGALDRRTGSDRDGTGMGWDSRAGRAGGNWDLATAPAVAHARRRWPAAPAAYTWTVHPVAPTCLRCSGDADRRCGPARTLAPATRPA